MNILQVDGPTLLTLLFSTDTAVWPPDWLLPIYLPSSWALVLSAGVLWALQTCTFRTRAVAGLGVVLACLLPGTLSPVHWLGLAFQTPSLMTLVLSVGVIWMQLQAEASARSRGQTLDLLSVSAWIAVAAVALGWCLLIDTLALWPFEFYRLGMMPLILWVLFAACALVWALTPVSGPLSCWAVLLCLALALHAVTRLPTGNVWDALLDPWLWGLAHVHLLKLGWRRWRLSRASA